MRKLKILHILSLTIELIIGFFALLIITKVLGKKQINQITPFDFISALVLGELLGNAIYDEKINIVFILYAMVLWACLMYIVEILTQKFKGTRAFFEGKPTILIRKGQIDYRELKKERLDINELLSMLRQKDIFSVREVEYAILEPGGLISVLKKSKYESPTRQDLNLIEKPVYLSVTLIADGEILWENLEESGYDEKWLKNQIKMQGVDKIKDVFYAEWKEDEGIYVVPK